MKRRPSRGRLALPDCTRHRQPYELRGGKPVCRFCESEDRAAAALCAPVATTT